MATECFMVLTGKGRDRECDQIVGTKRQADKERRDIIKMGFEPDEVSIKRFATWDEAEAFADKLRGR